MAAGRPTKYKAEFAKQAKKLCELGATDMDLAEFFEVNLTTINRWKIKYKQFCMSVKVSKGIPDDKVERSLYQRACGYSTTETKVFCNNGEITKEDVIKHYPPDPTSMIFWLKNRRPDDYREKQESNTGDLAESVSKLIDKLPD